MAAKKKNRKISRLRYMAHEHWAKFIKRTTELFVDHRACSTSRSLHRSRCMFLLCVYAQTMDRQALQQKFSLYLPASFIHMAGMVRVCIASHSKHVMWARSRSLALQCILLSLFGFESYTYFFFIHYFFHFFFVAVAVVVIHCSKYISASSFVSSWRERTVVHF